MQTLSELPAAFPAWTEAPVLGRLLLALVLGAAVGLERELSGKPAGLRTIVLITLGAELLTEASIVAAGFVPNDLVRADPARIAAQIVSGIGFIGAGTILVHRGSVVGLTTAATLWVAAAIGIAVGVRAYVVAVGATVLVVVTLVVLRWIERRFLPDRSMNILHLTLEGREADPAETMELLREHGFEVRRLGVEREERAARFDFSITGRLEAREALLERLVRRPDVRGVRIE